MKGSSRHSIIPVDDDSDQTSQSASTNDSESATTSKTRVSPSQILFLMIGFPILAIIFTALIIVGVALTVGPSPFSFFLPLWTPRSTYDAVPATELEKMILCSVYTASDLTSLIILVLQKFRRRLPCVGEKNRATSFFYFLSRISSFATFVSINVKIGSPFRDGYQFGWMVWGIGSQVAHLIWSGKSFPYEFDV